MVAIAHKKSSEFRNLSNGEDHALASLLYAIGKMFAGGDSNFIRSGQEMLKNDEEERASLLFFIPNMKFKTC